MASPILFRSLRSGRDRAGSAHPTIRKRGSSWSHLRPYTDIDDIRDIAWTKTKPDGLSVREREDHGDFEIIFCWEINPYGDFFTMNCPDSKNHAIQKAQHTIKISAQFGGYSYREFFGKIGFQKLKTLKPTNALIFICNTSTDNSLKNLAFHNDLIYLDIYHPFEVHPDTTELFSGQILDITSYQKAYQLLKEDLEHTIKNIQGSYLSCSTEDTIADSLNYFFKKRYHHG